MKHIKLFEGYLDKGYQKITYLEFQSLTGIVHSPTWGWSGPTDNYVDKDKEFKLKTIYDEWDKLRMMMDLSASINYVKFGEVMWKVGDFGYRHYIEMGDGYYIDIDIPKGYWIRIFGMDDDWYYVFMNGGDIPYGSGPECYKCDQFDGLLDLLKDKGIL